MTTEVALWITGATLPAMLAGIVHILMKVTRIREETHQLVKMHLSPDDYGFGSARTNRVIEDNTRAMNALSHYIEWLVKSETGRTPPPPLGARPQPFDGEG